MAFPYKTVLMVGCTAGIGLALAERMIENGIFVIGVGRRKERLDAFVAKHGADKAAASQFDVTNIAGIKEWAASITQAHPTIDCVVLNSGIQRSLDFTRPGSIDMAAVETELTTNYLSYIGLLAALLPQLQARAPAPAAVVVVTSGLGLVPIPRPVNYCATKAALHSVCWTMRAQLAHDERSRHVRVVELIPPAVQTELHHLQPDIAARGETDFGMPLDAYIEGAWAGLVRGEDEVAVGDLAVNNLAADAKRREIFAGIVALVDNPKTPYTVWGK